MKQNKMAAVREILATNPDATPAEIVSSLASQNLEISLGVASNYKSVIKSGVRGGPKKERKPRAGAPVAIRPTPGKNGAKILDLDPAIVSLLKAGKSLGWKRVRSIVDLMQGR
jgi:hypothetical protein